MSFPSPVLHMLCGKIAAGKSTLAARLGEEPATVVISEDAWLSVLFGDEMASLRDYLRYAARLKMVLGPHVIAVLRSGTSVVLDFPANRPEERDWMRGLFEQAGVAHRLHFLDLPDEVCRARMAARNADGDHPFAPTEAQFEQVTRHFVAPSVEEGFEVVVHEVRR